MQLAVFIVGCFVVAFTLNRRPIALVTVALGLRFFVPSVASVVFTGTSGDAQLHPASYFLAVAFVVTLLVRPRRVRGELSARPMFYGGLAVVWALGMATTLLQVGPRNAIVFIDTFGFGVLLCVMIGVAIDGSPERGRTVARWYVALAASQAIIALIQWSAGRTIFWERYMASYYWWSPTAERTSGTVGAWLDLATLLAVAVPLTASIRRVWLRFAISILLIVGILLAQGRTALVVAGACVVALVLFSSMRFGLRLLCATAIAGVAVYIASSPLIEGISGRNSTDTLSGQAREQAAAFALANLPSQPLFGTGFGSNGDTRMFGLISSFENGYLMYAWDFGIPCAVFMFVLLASRLLVPRRRRLVPGSLLSLASALFLIGTFSGLQTPGPTSWVLFVAIGLSAVRPRDRDPAGAMTVETAETQLLKPSGRSSVQASPSSADRRPRPTQGESPS